MSVVFEAERFPNDTQLPQRRVSVSWTKLPRVGVRAGLTSAATTYCAEVSESMTVVRIMLISDNVGRGENDLLGVSDGKTHTAVVV
ncbi:MAG: hypothetical protein P8K08_25545 [Fuerstiella sp.]|jgi:hypothetical protein|nr:hypothetical protein [Fuerstiella sp.]